MRVGTCIKDNAVYVLVVELVEAFDECPLAMELKVGDMQAIALRDRKSVV